MLEIAIHTLMGISFVAIVICIGLMLFNIIIWALQFESCFRQHLSTIILRNKGITDPNNKDRIAIVNYLVNAGLTYEVAIKFISDIHEYLINDKEDPWHRKDRNNV